MTFYHQSYYINRGVLELGLNLSMCNQGEDDEL
jgi:hypothetical protein